MIHIILNAGLLLMLLTLAILILRNENLISVVIISGLYSLVICTLFFIMDAVDVAFTEAAVGAGISTVLFLAVVKKSDCIDSVRWPSLTSILIALVVGVLLVMGTWDMPYYGDVSAPVHQHLAPRFLGQSGTEIGIPNVVTSILASYRGYDTFGEVTVIFTAGIAVYVILMEMRSDDKIAVTPLSKNRILSRGLITLIPLVLLFALYVQFHGDYGPGGGFQAGVIFGVGLITYGLLTNAQSAKAIMGEGWVIASMALGVLLYAGVGVAAMLMGGEFLNYSVLAQSSTAGQHLGIFLVELGVGITVAATMISLYYSFYRE